MDESSQDAYLTLFSVIASLVAVIAFVGLMFLRTNSNLLVESQTPSPRSIQMVAPVLFFQSLTQDQAKHDEVTVGYPGPQSPPENASLSLLTPGALSVPLQLHVDFSDANGLVMAIQRPSAVFTVVAVQGDASQQSCNQNDGGHCWTAQFSGSDLSAVTAASPDPDEVNGHFFVPISLPYYAQSGTWTLWWSIVPVDVNGVPQPHYALTNDSTPLRFIVGSLTAARTTETLSYTVRGQVMPSDQDSDPEPVTVFQQGNVPLSLYVSGSDWTCSGGRSMPVSITKVTGASHLTWNDSSAKTLVTSKVSRIQILGEADTDWSIPLTEGNMVGRESRSGESTYLTMIHPLPDIYGTCSSTMMNYVAEHNF